MSDKPITIREACRRRMPLDGADAQCLEHAITITERERDEWKARVENTEADLRECLKRADWLQGECTDAKGALAVETQHRREAEARLALLAESGTGYSQETVDAITKERETLRGEVARLTQRVSDLKFASVLFSTPFIREARAALGIAGDDGKVKP